MQNNKRYWLRGLLIGVIMSILILLIIILSPVYCIGLSADGTSCISPKGFEAIVFNVKTIGDYLIMAVFYFVIIPIATFTFFGYLYGKIKNRNKV